MSNSNSNYSRSPSIANVNDWGKILSSLSPVMNQINGLQPGEITILCAYYMGLLSAQLPITSPAFVEGMEFFRALMTKFIAFSPEASQALTEGVLVFLAPESLNPDSNLDSDSNNRNLDDTSYVSINSVKGEV